MIMICSFTRSLEPLIAAFLFCLCVIFLPHHAFLMFFSATRRFPCVFHATCHTTLSCVFFLPHATCHMLHYASPAYFSATCHMPHYASLAYFFLPQYAYLAYLLPRYASLAYTSGSPQPSLNKRLRVRHLMSQEGNPMPLRVRTFVDVPSPRSIHADLQLPGTGRTFSRAQVEGPFPPVLYASAVIRTRLLNVQQPNYGITPTLQLPSGPTSHSPCVMEGQYVTTGSDTQDAPIPPMTIDISVPAAPLHLTELKDVLELRKSQALTPYNPQVWESLLMVAGLSQKYPSLPQNLRSGFIINIPKFTSTQIPPNSPTIEELHVQFEEIVKLELLKKRYIGPFSRQKMESFLGPFQSSPFSIIPKPGKPGRFRIIQNYSFPHNTTSSHPNPSINSFLNPDEFPTTWGTFTIISLIIHQLPPHSQIATRDVAEAYRTIPLHYSQWPGTVVRTGNDAFCVDTVASFVFSPSAGTYGLVADAGSDIFRSKGIGPLAKWVDDHVFFRIRREFLDNYNQQRQSRHLDLLARGQIHQGGRLWFEGTFFSDGTLNEHVEDCHFPCRDLSSCSSRSEEDALYAYNFDDIDALSDALGIPWEKSKDLPFSTSSSYIGFKWDLRDHTVSLTPEKRQKYSGAIADWLLHPRHALNDVQKLYGKLLHACLVVPAGRSYLTNLEAMLVLCGPHPFKSYSSPKGLHEDLSWWSLKLASHLYRPIPAPLNLHDIQAFSDASSGFGIAITIRDRWRAWRLIPGWQTLDGARDIGWAEAVGFELLVKSIPGFVGVSGHFKIYGDNKGVVEGWWNHRSKNTASNRVFRRIHAFLEPFNHSFSIHSAYVPSKDNPADPPSRGLYPPVELLLPEIQLPADLSRFIIDATLPYSPTEIRRFRENRYPSAIADRIDRFLKGDDSI